MEGRIEHHDVLSARQFFLAVKRLADSLSYGMDRSPFLGSGVEYVQSRPYQYGDPIKLIDWRVTARTRKVHVKEYEAPKRMPVYLLVDTSASMTISSHRPEQVRDGRVPRGGPGTGVPRSDQPGRRAGRGLRGPCTFGRAMSRDQVLEWLHRLRRFRYDETDVTGVATDRALPKSDAPGTRDRLERHARSPAVPALKRTGAGARLRRPPPARPGRRSAAGRRASSGPAEAETGRGFAGPRPAPRI